MKNFKNHSIYITFDGGKHSDGTDYASIETKQEKENLQLIFVLGDSFVASMYVMGFAAMQCIVSTRSPLDFILIAHISPGLFAE